MEFKKIINTDSEWSEVAEYAYNCSWSAGKHLAKHMKNNDFLDWERVIIAKEKYEIAGYCKVSKNDCIPNVAYTPYISFMFVDEKYRGNRLSQKLIEYAMGYLKELGFVKVYLVSDHINLYEKYDFKVIDRQLSNWGEEEKIYMRELSV